MSNNEMLKCLIAFILGWLLYPYFGNGFRVGAITLPEQDSRQLDTTCKGKCVGKNDNDIQNGDNAVQQLYKLFKNGVKDITAVEDCKKWCVNVKECKGFTWDTKKKKCYLKATKCENDDSCNFINSTTIY